MNADLRKERFIVAEARRLAPEVKLLRVHAPEIARRRKAGQFVILRVNEEGERIPLTIADSDQAEGTVTLIVQAIGKTTKMLSALEAGDSLSDIVGPLGKPSEIDLYGNAVVIGGGVGTAIAYPTARALKEAGNYVISILGGRTRELVILESEMRAISDEMFVTTDDGSLGEKGLVTDRLQSLIDEGGKLDFVLAIGPIPMMAAVAEVTRPKGIRTVVSLNPIMVDGTGMCGGCRVLVGGQSQFACVDGPEFDAHQVDFRTLATRNAMYREAERHASDGFDDPKSPHECRLKAEVADAGPKGGIA